MTDFTPLYAAAEQKYNLPPGLLKAQGWVESRFNPKAVSPKGAQGIAQLMPGTAQGMGVDPFDPAQAIDAQARIMAHNLAASGGDIDRAAMMYDAGPKGNFNNPETQAYPGKIAAALSSQGPQPQPKGGDPIEAALSGQPVQANTAPQGADPNDPIEKALSGGKSGNALVSNGAVVHGAGDAGAPVGPNGNGVPDTGAGRNLGSPPQGAQGQPAGTQASGLQQDPLNLNFRDVGNWLNGTANAAVNGVTAGLAKPFDAALDAFIPGAAGKNTQTVWDGTSLGDAFHHDLALERQQADAFRASSPGSSLTADILGAVASPFNKLFAPSEGVGFLRSIPNFMGQGAAYGGVRGYADTGDPSTAAADAVVGGVLGPAAAGVATGAGRALGAVLRARSTLANAIPLSVKQQVAAMIDKGASVDDILAAVPDAKDLEYIPEWVGYRARGGTAPVSFASPPEVAANSADDAPIVITGKRYAAALGTQGQRRGVEAISDVPPQVADNAQRLIAAGISPQEAQAEADIRYVGAKPTVANVTRNPAEQRAMFEGAKQDTPEGAQLADTIAQNNQALHNTITGTVENYGGVPAQGEAAETAAQTLANASDAAKSGVTAKYQAARAQDGDVRINTDELRELLQSPQMATPANPQIQQLSNGVLSFLRATDQRAGTTLRTPEEVEQIRQLANSAYDPMGGPVNGAVGKVGAALNDSLDQLDQASQLYRAARAAHRDWASQYADPAGIARLIARDAQGNFLNADQWRLNENGLIGRLDDKPFAQVVGQLKKIGATDALNKLKAGIVQQAYERATNTARDQLGNPIVNGKLFQSELNRIGLPKLQALFEPQELAHLATIGRAARALNEAVPGTVNTSGTSSSLINALSAKPGSHPLMKAMRATKYVSAGAGHLHAAVVLHGAEHLSGSSAQRAVSQGIREQLNPALARVAGGRSASRIENAQYRAAIGRMLRNRGAAPAADNDRARAMGRKLSSAF